MGMLDKLLLILYFRARETTLIVHLRLSHRDRVLTHLALAIVALVGGSSAKYFRTRTSCWTERKCRESLLLVDKLISYLVVHSR